MNAKQTLVPAWLVPHLGRKVRQLKREETALRHRIAELHGQLMNIQREHRLQLLSANEIANFWENQSNRYFNDNLAAYRKIGGLHYLLEQAGVTIPNDLK